MNLIWILWKRLCLLLLLKIEQSLSKIFARTFTLNILFKALFILELWIIGTPNVLQELQGNAHLTIKWKQTRKQLKVIGFFFLSQNQI